MELKVCQYIISQAFDPAVAAMPLQMAARLLNPTADLQATDRLLIYRHSITSAQQRVLRMVFPVCAKILGEACFENIGRDYAWLLNSNCSDLNVYGKNLPDWLETQLAYYPSLADYHYLPDLARLEYLWQQSLFSADDPGFDATHLAGLVEQHADRLIPRLSHSLYLFTSAWPVYAIWQSHQQDSPLSNFTLPDETQHYVIYRQDRPGITEISAATHRFLLACQNGLALCQIADRLGDQAAIGFAQLADFIRNGWITGFTTITTGQK